MDNDSTTSTTNTTTSSTSTIRPEFVPLHSAVAGAAVVINPKVMSTVLGAALAKIDNDQQRRLHRSFNGFLKADYDIIVNSIR
jgi:hypothetical protein